MSPGPEPSAAPEPARLAGRADPHRPRLVGGRPRRRRRTAADLVEGLSLADLVAEEFGVARRARPHRPPLGPRPGGADADADRPGDARVAALERTVAQLEHALAARVSTERAIGVLAERHGTSAARRVRGAAPRRPLPGPPRRRARPRGPRRPGATRDRRRRRRRRRLPAPAAPGWPPPSPRAACRRPPAAAAAADGRLLTRPRAAHPARARRPPRRRSSPRCRPSPGAAALRVAVDGPDVAGPERPGHRGRRAAARRWAGPPSSSRPPASTGRPRCGWSTAAPIPTPATPTGSTPAR